MRKFAKILTIVLALSLLCGTLALVPSATSSDGNLTVSSDQVTAYNPSDFEDENLGLRTTFEWHAVNDQSYADRFKVVTANGNKYAQQCYTKADCAAGSTAWIGTLLSDVQFKSNFNKATSILSNDYAVLDFDIASDKYISEDKTFVNSGDGADSLAYSTTEFKLIARYRLAGTLKAFAGVTAVKIWSDGEYDSNDLKIWYIGDGENNKHQLPSVPGVFTHVSCVFDIDNTVNYADGTTGKFDALNAANISSLNISNTKCHVYINGEYTTTFSPFAASADTASTYVQNGTSYFDTIAFDTVRITPTEYKTTDFSIGVDNVVTNYYKQGYTGDLSAYLDGDYTASLSTNSDVVYTDAYKTPGTDAKATVVFDKAGSKLYATEQFTPGSAVAHPTAIGVDLVDGKLLLGWSTKEGSTTPENIVAGVAGSTITVYPVFDEGIYEYLIICDSEILYKGTDISKIRTDFAKTYSSSTGSKYSNVEIILGTDLDVQKDLTATLFVFSCTVSLDLNGYDIYHCFVQNTGVYAIFSYASNNGAVKIYSSEPGSDIISIYYQPTVSTPTHASIGLVSTASSRSGNSFTIGNGTDNLTIHTPILMFAKEPNFKLNINGGKILAPRKNSKGLIIADTTGTNLTIDVKNAFIAGSTILFVARSDGSGYINGTIDNSTLVADTIFGEWNNSHVTLTNTELVGGATVSASTDKPGQVTLSVGCKTTFELPENMVVDSDYVWMEKSTEKDVSYSVYYPQYDGNSSFTQASMTTPNKTTKTARFIYEVVTQEEAPREITVTWIYKDKEIATETYLTGSVATFKGTINFNRIDPWFVEDISGWQNASGEANFVVSHTNNVFYAVPTVKIDIQPLYNYATTTGFESHLFVPVPSENSGIVITSICEGEASENLMSDTTRCVDVTVEGVAYKMMVAYPGVCQDESTSYTVEYTYGGNTYSETFVVKSLVNYFNQVLSGDVDNETLSLIVHAANYCKTVVDYVTNDVTVFDDIVSTYAEYLTEIEDSVILSDYVMNTEALKPYLEGATFSIGDGYLPLYAFKPVEGSGITSVTWSYDSYDGNTYIRTATSGEHWDGYLANGGSIGVYDIRKPITISCGGAEGTYSLAAYITYLQSLEGTNRAESKALAVVKALYAYSVASYNYKTRHTNHVYDHEYDSTCNFEGCDYTREVKMPSVLLLGQSNMSGRGYADNVAPIRDDRIKMMRNYEWVKMQEPIHTDTGARIGLAASFAKAFVETFNCEVGLIPAAVGGKKIENFAPGTDLYNEALKCAKAAQETSEICAILWHHGEGNQEDTDYAAKVQEITDSLIEELGLDKDKIVIITGELFGTRSDAVHMSELEELGKNYKNYGIAMSDGLTVFDEITHFDAPSLRVFGYRYFDIFYNIKTGKHYEFNNNPEDYIVINNFIEFDFDDFNTGSAVNSAVQINAQPQEGKTEIVDAGAGDKYLNIQNGIKDDGKYGSAFVDISYAADPSSVITLEARIKLGEGHKVTTNILRLFDSENKNYSGLFVGADGKLYNMTAGDNTTQTDTGYSLSTTEWTNIKIVFDMKNNTKTVYINGVAVITDAKVSTTDVSSVSIVKVRISQFTNNTNFGNICFDTYKCTVE